MELIKLTAEKQNGSTFFKDANGKLKGVIPPEQKQPNRNTKFYTLNCCLFAINWIN